ncbi:MAG: type II toxin-antitoxin system MqsA family antitoxin [Clostridia bacterium]|nr:type II toxin-antitoxin system MqsA family antitoxin [Clostridia bacterium]
MKCFRCKGEMRPGVTTFVTDKDDCCIVIRRVPCLQCDACGEVAFNGEVAENLERLVKAARQTLTEVAVLKYPEAVA